ARHQELTDRLLAGLGLHLDRREVDRRGIDRPVELEGDRLVLRDLADRATDRPAAEVAGDDAERRGAGPPAGPVLTRRLAQSGGAAARGATRQGEGGSREGREEEGSNLHRGRRGMAYDRAATASAGTHRGSRGNIPAASAPGGTGVRGPSGGGEHNPTSMPANDPPTIAARLPRAS